MTKVLNLVHPDQSDITYKVSNFPDGQRDITIDVDTINLSMKMEGKLAPLIYTPDIVIKSRFNSFEDLGLIICATKALRNCNVKNIQLYVPYILGARSDRQFVEGGNSYLRDVIAPILNAQNYDCVTCIDVHSDVATACINKLQVIDNIGLVEWAIKDLGLNHGEFLLVSPDAGSLKKIYKIAEAIGYTDQVITCSKYRDTNGKLSKTQVPIGVYDCDKHLVIIDDICDGGGTFLGIADGVNHARSLSSITHSDQHGKLSLIVTHGIFSRGFDDLSNHFDSICCTDSYRRIDEKEINSKSFSIKQLEIF